MLLFLTCWLKKTLLFSPTYIENPLLLGCISIGIPLLLCLGKLTLSKHSLIMHLCYVRSVNLMPNSSKLTLFFLHMDILKVLLKLTSNLKYLSLMKLKHFVHVSVLSTLNYLEPQSRLCAKIFSTVIHFFNIQYGRL